MSTHALDPHNAPSNVLSGMLGGLNERMPNSLISIFQRTKTRVTQVLNMPRQIREMIDRVKDGHPLSKAEWTAISALPL